MSNMTEEPIVVGVDGMDPSDRAVRYAVEEAQRLGCGLRLVHVAPEMVPRAPMLPMVSEESLEQLGRRIVNESKRLAEDVAGGELAVETVVRTGTKAHNLVEAAEDARLVVLGHRDRSVLGRMFTGSTSTGVAARAQCPVVCVPAAWEPEGDHHHVVVGVHDMGPSHEPLAVAFAAAASRKAKLSVLHAWKMQSPYDDIIASRSDVEEWKSAVSTKLDNTLAEWRERYPDVDVELDVSHQFPATALVGATEGADLVVVGRHGHRTRLGAHLGSIARTLIREARCPVVIAPPQPR